VGSCWYCSIVRALFDGLLVWNNVSVFGLLSIDFFNSCCIWALHVCMLEGNEFSSPTLSLLLFCFKWFQNIQLFAWRLRLQHSNFLLQLVGSGLKRHRFSIMATRVPFLSWRQTQINCQERGTRLLIEILPYRNVLLRPWRALGHRRYYCLQLP
jgi:hypothetical protein